MGIFFAKLFFNTPLPENHARCDICGYIKAVNETTFSCNNRRRIANFSLSEIYCIDCKENANGHGIRFSSSSSSESSESDMLANHYLGINLDDCCLNIDVPPNSENEFDSGDEFDEFDEFDELV